MDQSGCNEVTLDQVLQQFKDTSFNFDDPKLSAIKTHLNDALEAILGKYGTFVNNFSYVGLYQLVNDMSYCLLEISNKARYTVTQKQNLITKLSINLEKNAKMLFDAETKNLQNKPEDFYKTLFSQTVKEAVKK